MKIGILTFHRATNYGAVLQAYALVSYLNSIGYDAKIIDYKPKGMGQLYASVSVPGIFKKAKRVVLNILMLQSLRARKAKRDMYWEYISNVLPMTNPVLDEKDFPELDAIFVGSDQVWSTCFTGGLDRFYWGQFDRKGAKLMSYAGSAAEDMQGSFYSTDNAKLLMAFDEISVREDELQIYLQKSLPEKQIVKVLDPTLMAGVSYFDELIKDEKPLERPYILVYQVIRSKDSVIQNYAKQLSEEYGCDVVEIKNGRLYTTNNGKTVVSDGLINPTQFVSLYKYAKYIVTTSFHGTAFSLLFNRPFDVVSVSPDVDSRAKDLLEQIGLRDRMVSLPIQTAKKDINWNLVNRTMDDYRKPSRQFITDSLKK